LCCCRCDALHIRNDQLQRAGRGDHAHSDRDSKVGEAEDVPESCRPPAIGCAGRHYDRGRQGEQSRQHVADACRQCEHAGQRTAHPGRESPAAEYAVELKRDEPARRYLVEHLPDPLREQQQRTADDHRQEDRRWQHR
jgi:hypothetical protein